MKTTLMLIYGVFLFLPFNSSGQEKEFMTTADFQAEKKRLQESLQRLSRSNQDLRSFLVSQQAILDSLTLNLAEQHAQIALQQDSLTRIQTLQSSFDDRLLTQKKSGTMLAIVIPAGLFLLILCLLIWLIVLNRRINNCFSQFRDEMNLNAKRFEEHLAAYQKEETAQKERFDSLRKELDERFVVVSGETDRKIQKLEEVVQEEKVAHESIHQASHQATEALKVLVETDMKALSGELKKLEKEITAAVKDLSADLTRLRKEQPGK